MGPTQRARGLVTGPGLALEGSMRLLCNSNTYRTTVIRVFLLPQLSAVFPATAWCGLCLPAPQPSAVLYPPPPKDTHQPWCVSLGGQRSQGMLARLPGLNALTQPHPVSEHAPRSASATLPHCQSTGSEAQQHKAPTQNKAATSTHKQPQPRWCRASLGFACTRPPVWV